MTGQDLIERFLSVSDARRALICFQKIVRHDISGWALTGGFATELHCLRFGSQPTTRALNDLDFVASAFDSLPATLANGFLFRHIHPLDPPGKTMLQLIDPVSALRVDVFRAEVAILRRACRMDLGFATIQVVSVEDLVARAARLVLDIGDGVPVNSRHARDFLRLIELADAQNVEMAWRTHRKPTQPIKFGEASRRLGALIATHSKLLVTPNYSNDTESVCPRCASTREFKLADPKLVLSLLGYC